MIRILTWLWSQPGGRTKFTAEHVNVWASMVRRNCSIPFSLACVTDMPQGIDPGVEIIQPPGDFYDIQPKWGPRKPNCFRRLSLYRRDAAEIFGGARIASFDLDCVIGDDLAPILNRREDLVLFKGTHPDRPYNGSLQLLTAGCRPRVFERFNQTAADASGERFVGSDQAWLAQCLGRREKVWAERDGVYFYGQGSIYSPKTTRPRILFFPGKLKPWVLAPLRIDPFVSSNYRILEREAA